MILNKKVLGVDFDDVLIPFNKTLFDFYNKVSGKSVEVKDHNQFDVEKTWNCSVDEMRGVLDNFYNSTDLDNALPIEGAIEFLNKLKEKYSFVVVTARPEEKASGAISWLEKHFGKGFFDKVVFTRQKTTSTSILSKSQVCKELGVSIFIDDALHNAEDLASAGIEVLLLDKNWNQKGPLPDKVTRVHSWEEIAERLI